MFDLVSCRVWIRINIKASCTGGTDYYRDSYPWHCWRHSRYLNRATAALTWETQVWKLRVFPSRWLSNLLCSQQTTTAPSSHPLTSRSSFLLTPLNVEMRPFNLVTGIAASAVESSWSWNPIFIFKYIWGSSHNSDVSLIAVPSSMSQDFTALSEEHESRSGC